MPKVYLKSPARELIRGFIKETAWNMRSLSREVGLNDTYFSQYLRKGSPSVLPEDVRCKLAEIFNVDESDFRDDGRASSRKYVGLPVGVQEPKTPFEGQSPVTLNTPTELVDQARAYDLDVEALLLSGGIPALRTAYKAEYIKRNQAGIDWAHDYVGTYGTPSQQAGAWGRETS